MFAEHVLDEYNEDPVQIVRVRKDRTEIREDDGEEYKVDIYRVEHINETRGSEHVVKYWVIEVAAELDIEL